MSARQRSTPPWLPDLTEQVRHGLQLLTAGKHDQRPALEQEVKQLQEKIQGWSASLAKPNLAAAVREAIEADWSAAAERVQEIEAELSELRQKGTCAEQLVRPEQVLDRVEHLAEVLAANDPTRGNLELSLHIDRIVCSQDGRVTLRMCKLGIMPDAVRLLSLPIIEAPGDITTNSKLSRARRRAKLRVIEDEGAADLRAQANFVADPDRFAGLGDEWFWLDELRIPESSCWARDHAEIVFWRRQKSRLSYAKLAAEFGVTSPTIGAAIRWYLKTHPGERDEVVLQRGGKRRPKFDLSQFADEARQLWIDGWSKEKLARKYRCSPPTVGKAIAISYAQEGLPMPTREEARRDKVLEARRLFDKDKSLEAIATAMKVSDVTARQYLRDSFAAEGKSMPDLRRRKGA